MYIIRNCLLELEKTIFHFTLKLVTMAVHLTILIFCHLSKLLFLFLHLLKCTFLLHVVCRLTTSLRISFHQPRYKCRTPISYPYNSFHHTSCHLSMYRFLIHACYYQPSNLSTSCHQAINKFRSLLFCFHSSFLRTWKHQPIHILHNYASYPPCNCLCT